MENRLAFRLKLYRGVLLMGVLALASAAGLALLMTSREETRPFFELVASHSGRRRFSPEVIYFGVGLFLGCSTLAWLVLAVWGARHALRDARRLDAYMTERVEEVAARNTRRL